MPASSLLSSLNSIPVSEQIEFLQTLKPAEKRAVFNALDEHYMQNPHDWFAHQAWTNDEAEQATRPWKDAVYVRDLITVFQHERRVAIPKSRREFASWTCAGWLWYNARFFENQACFFQSEIEDKAAFIVEHRCMFLEDHITFPELRRKYRAIRTNKGLVGRMNYSKSGSYVWGIPQGADAIRTYTFSILVMDESEFQNEGADALVAALPTVEKKAQIILLSSSNGPGGVLAGICKEAGFVKFS